MQSNPYVSSLSDGVLTQVLEHHLSGQAFDLYARVKTWNCEVWLIYTLFYLRWVEYEVENRKTFSNRFWNLVWWSYHIWRHSPSFVYRQSRNTYSIFFIQFTLGARIQNESTCWVASASLDAVEGTWSCLIESYWLPASALSQSSE